MSSSPQPDSFESLRPPSKPPDRHETPSGAQQTPGAGPPPGAGIVLAPGFEPVAGYVLEKRLGQGGFGEVWRARGPGGFSVALKFLRLGERAAAVEARSLDFMKDVRHPHLIGMFGAWQADTYLVIAMELVRPQVHEF